MYRWLYSDLLSKGELSVLRHKGKRQRPRETKGRFNVGTPISHRPKEIKGRKTFGHWKLDTIISSRGKAKTVLRLLLREKQECT